MTIERGLKRVLVVLSVLCTIVVTVLPTILVPERATWNVFVVGGEVEITINKDIERHMYEQVRGMGHVTECRSESEPPNTPNGLRFCATEVHSSAYWKVRDAAIGAIASLILVALLWTTFYTVRWVVRGFSQGGEQSA